MYILIHTYLGSILVAGSNPNSDYVEKGVKYPTQYKVELFYPWYYNSRRPEPEGLPTQLSYGGPSFIITLTLEDLGGDILNIGRTKVVVIRTGFSTHAMVSVEVILHALSWSFAF
jgi:hypothetical protein